MKTIDTLVEDIYAVLDTDSYTLTGSSVREPRTEKRTLRMSNVGKPCTRQLWYEINDSEGGESLLPHTKLKFSYGDILEDVLLDLAEMAGHKVECRQHEVSVNGIRGHMDAVIDGMVVDVKSASKFSFKKFENHLSRDEDGFGYLTQLGGYLLGMQEDPRVTYKNQAAFLAINKETGKLHLDVHEFTRADLTAIESGIERAIRETGAPVPPSRAFAPEPDGKSGNLKLGVQCSYCPYKFKCYPSTRVFLYSNGPRYLTRVGSLPKVPEIGQDGELINEGENF